MGPINAHNEWDPLEEVVLGNVYGARFPKVEPGIRAVLSPDQFAYFESKQGSAFPPELIDAAARELDGLAAILEREGVTVRQLEASDHSLTTSNGRWRASGLYDAMPRDAFLVVGDELIECPMSWRCRQNAVLAMRPLAKDYSRAGSRWTSAPRPELPDELFRPDYTPSETTAGAIALSEFEPVFDGADFLRFGSDLVCQRSNVTNDSGISWLKSHLGPDYRIHTITLTDSRPMHIDASLLPLAPGKLLVNPKKVDELPPIFEDWEVRNAPPPSLPSSHPLYMTTAWITMNLLSVDTQRVLVETHEGEPTPHESYSPSGIRCPQGTRQSRLRPQGPQRSAN